MCIKTNVLLSYLSTEDHFRSLVAGASELANFKLGITADSDGDTHFTIINAGEYVPEDVIISNGSGGMYTVGAGRVH